MSNGTFNQLNDALFAQLDRLQSVSPSDTEKMEQTIEQSKAVSTLAAKIIDNSRTAVNLMALRYKAEDGMNGVAAKSMDRMLGSGE